MPRRQQAVDYYQAKESFVTMLNDEPTTVAKGDLVHPDHPILKGREELFQPAEGHIRFDVEDATAAPGRKRGDTGDTEERADEEEPEKPAEKAAKK
jgi:hypothetical protein